MILLWDNDWSKFLLQTASIWLKHKPKAAKDKPMTKAAEVPSLTQEEENQMARSR